MVDITFSKCPLFEFRPMKEEVKKRRKKEERVTEEQKEKGKKQYFTEKLEYFSSYTYKRKRQFFTWVGFRVLFLDGQVLKNWSSCTFIRIKSLRSTKDQKHKDFITLYTSYLHSSSRLHVEIRQNSWYSD